MKLNSKTRAWLKGQMDVQSSLMETLECIAQYAENGTLTGYQIAEELRHIVVVYQRSNARIEEYV